MFIVVTFNKEKALEGGAFSENQCHNWRTLLVVVVFAEVHAELVAGGADLLAVGAGVLRQPGQVPRLHVVLQGRQVALGPIRDEHCGHVTRSLQSQLTWPRTMPQSAHWYSFPPSFTILDQMSCFKCSAEGEEEIK